MHGDIVIKKVTTQKELKRFIRFQYHLYKNSPNFIPPIFVSEYNKLHWEKNPAFEYCEATYWLAYKKEKIVGRIAAIINNRHIEKTKKKYIRWGWFESVEDKNVAKKLFQTVEAFAREKHMTAVHGPLGFVNIDPEGLLIEGFDELGTYASNFNMPYYREYVEDFGFEKDVDWIEFQLAVPDQVPQKINKLAGVVEKRFGYKPVKIDSKKELIGYSGQIMDLIVSTYSELYGVVPFSDRQKKQIENDFKPMIDPRFCCLVKDKNGELIGFGLTMLSLVKAMQKIRGKLFPFGFLEILKAQRKNNRLELLLIGILPEHRGKGVDTIIFKQIIPELIKFGIRDVESNQILEYNDKVIGLFKTYNARQHRRARCYIKYLV